ncbi:MAG: Rrf2 family transcriptional regulator [Planctomycetota bacterium]|jgi:Rrf2 family iron-sulfur cluster assembly transcriptional regulator
MQIGTRVRYGMLAMMDLARRGSAVPARALDIAKAHGLSKGYLEGLLAALRRAGLVRAIRGPGGGWVLARPASRIWPADVFEALEGSTALVPCAEDARACHMKIVKRGKRRRRCRAQSLWVAMGRSLSKVLRAVSLAVLSGIAPKRRPRKAAKAGKAKSSKIKGKTGTKPKAKSRAKSRTKSNKAPRARIVKRRAPKRSKIVKGPARRRLRKSA